jgi:septum formation protein
MVFLELVKSFDIILGSQSPRRKELMARTGIPFRVLTAPFSEEVPRGWAPARVVTHLCREKAGFFGNELIDPRVVVITADTVVADRSHILNKPGDAEEAMRMLRQLSGRWHRVLTGVCIRHRDQTMVFHETTRVRFRPLEDNEMDYYIRQFSPFDKAGAYGIQEWIGAVGIEEVRGCYLNVVGLPVPRLYGVLKEMLSAGRRPATG